MKKKTYIINHIPIKQMWKGKYYIGKRCKNMDGSKNAKKHNEKKNLYNISKDQSSKIR